MTKDKLTNIGGTGGSPVLSMQLKVTCRNLPHWEMSGSTYFITYRTSGIKLTESERDIVLENWKYWNQKRYQLWAIVIMPTHVHVLLTPLCLEKGDYYSLEKIIHTAKSWTAHQLKKKRNHQGVVWQDERYDRIVRDEGEFMEKWNYILENPIKEGLAEKGEDYRWYFGYSE